MGFITKLYKKSDSTKTAVTSGSGSQDLVVVVPAFTGRETRNDSKEFTTGEVSKTLSVSQTGKEVFLKSSQSSETTISATGGTFKLQGTSNSANIKLSSGTNVISGVTATLTIDGNLQSNWNGTTNIAVSNDPGATADYTWVITFVIPENQTESQRIHSISVTDASNLTTGDHSKSVQFTQEAGVKNYNTPTVSLSYNTLGAGAVSESPSVTVSQTWGWNNSNTNGGTITPSYTATYTLSTSNSSLSINSSTGVVTTTSYENNYADASSNYGVVSLSIVANGTTASTSYTLSRVANTITYTDNFTITYASIDDIPASGGTISTIPCIVEQSFVFTSGYTGIEMHTDVNMTITPSSGITGGNLGTTTKARTKLGTLTGSFTLNGKSGTASIDVYQAANGYNLTYSDISYSPTSPVTLSGSGQSYTITQNASQTITYESGSTRSGSITYSYTVKTAATGFSNSSNVVTVTSNTSTSTRGTFVLTVTATGEGSKSTAKDISFTQSAGTRTYGDIEILSYTYANDTSGYASMKSSTQVLIAEVAATTDAPTVTYRQTWGWNGSTTGGGTITSGATLSFSDNIGAGGGLYGSVDTSGRITVTTTGEEETAEEKIMEIALAVTLNGKSATKVMEVWRAANTVTYMLEANFLGGEDELNPIDYTSEVGEDIDIPASGGSRASVSGLTVTATKGFSNGTISDTVITVPSSNITYSTAVSATSLGTTVKSRTQVGTLTVTASYGDATATYYIAVYQKANAKTYGNVTHSGITSYTFSNGNEAASYTYTVANQNAAQTISYTSGSTESGSITLTISRASSSVARFTVSGTTVNITASPYSTQEQVGTITVTLTGQGGKSATYNTIFYQAAGSVTLVIDPETLTFDYTGGEQDVTITSNSSWTIKD